MNRFSCFRRAVFAPPDAPGSTPPASPGSTSATSSSGGAPSPPSSGVTPPGSTVAPGVEPPPGAPGSTVPDASLRDADPTSDFMSIFDGPSDPSVVTPPAVPAVTPPAAPAAAPAPPATPAVTAPPVDPAATPVGPGDGGQPPAGTPPASGAVLDPYDPGGLARAIQGNEQATVEYVAQTMFQLSQEDLQGLETDIAATVPKLFARAFVKSQVNQLLQLSNIIPEMVRRATSDMRNHSQNEDAFYSKWPQIDRTKHGDLVKRFGITYRQLNPTVSKDEMIDHVGQLVLMAAKLPVTASVNGTVPAAPVNGARSAPHQPSPFTPAVPGPAAASQPTVLNPWEAMFEPHD